jgi:hypothetical protein
VVNCDLGFLLLADMYASLVHTASLHLNGNAFTGTIPDELGALTLLTSLALEGNELSGLIPISLGFMRSLGRFKPRDQPS